MKRRNFIRGLGLGSAGLVASKATALDSSSTNSPLPPFNYGKIQNLDEAKTEEGLIIVRIELKGHPEKEPYFHKGKIRVKDAEIRKMKSYFFG